MEWIETRKQCPAQARRNIDMKKCALTQHVGIAKVVRSRAGIKARRMVGMNRAERKGTR
jgi:hypothetical protein